MSFSAAKAKIYKHAMQENLIRIHLPAVKKNYQKFNEYHL